MLGTPLIRAEDLKKVTIQTPGGEVSWKEEVSKGKQSFDDRIELLSDKELAGLRRDSERAPVFIAAFVPPEHRTDNLLEDMDAAFTAWLKSGQRDKFNNEDVIRIIGAAFGNYCIQHLGLHWARVTDKQGTAVALVSDHPLTRSFPFTSVQYRIEDNKTDFIYAIYASLEQLMKDAKK